MQLWDKKCCRRVTENVWNIVKKTSREGVRLWKKKMKRKGGRPACWAVWHWSNWQDDVGLWVKLDNSDRMVGNPFPSRGYGCSFMAQVQACQNGLSSPFARGTGMPGSHWRLNNINFFRNNWWPLVLPPLGKEADDEKEIVSSGDTMEYEMAWVICRTWQHICMLVVWNPNTPEDLSKGV